MPTLPFNPKPDWDDANKHTVTEDTDIRVNNPSTSRLYFEVRSVPDLPTIDVKICSWVPDGDFAGMQLKAGETLFLAGKGANASVLVG